MKKIIPFKKEITLETNIAGINSISLEHTLEKKEENIISGDFIVSGAYKMTPSSIALDNFEYKLPVNITIDSKYNTDNIKIDINDFYYEVINDKILAINIEVAIDELEEKKEEERKEVLEVDVKEEVEPEKQEEKEEKEETRNTKSIFNTFDDNDNYVVYKIHVITENDTIESIMDSYQVTKDVLDMYNDLDNIKIGDKLIIADNGN